MCVCECVCVVGEDARAESGMFACAYVSVIDLIFFLLLCITYDIVLQGILRNKDISIYLSFDHDLFSRWLYEKQPSTPLDLVPISMPEAYSTPKILRQSPPT